MDIGRLVRNSREAAKGMVIHANRAYPARKLKRNTYEYQISKALDGPSTSWTLVEASYTRSEEIPQSKITFPLFKIVVGKCGPSHDETDGSPRTKYACKAKSRHATGFPK